MYSSYLLTLQSSLFTNFFFLHFLDFLSSYPRRAYARTLILRLSPLLGCRLQPMASAAADEDGDASGFNSFAHDDNGVIDESSVMGEHGDIVRMFTRGSVTELPSFPLASSKSRESKCFSSRVSPADEYTNKSQKVLFTVGMERL